MTCVNCGNPGSPAPIVPELCAKCWKELPSVTRDLYRTGRLKVRKVRAGRGNHAAK